MNGPGRAVLATALALTAAAPVGSWPVAGAGPVEEAREAARHATFTAKVTVTWVDARGHHATSLNVRAAGGLVRVDGQPSAGSGGLVIGDGWLRLAQANPAFAATPAMEQKYEVERLSGPVVAGRSTSLVIIRAADRVRERLAIDESSGLVLRRELFGSGGRLVRVVTVTTLQTSALTPPADRLPVDRAEPVHPARLSAAYAAPSVLSGGYRRVAAYRRGQVVHVLYTDGLHGLSLFVQPGRIDRSGLPSDGRVVRLGEADGLRYTWAGGEIVTWQSGPVVRTLMGDAIAEEVLAAARSVPAAPNLSVLGRLRGACRQVAEALSGGR